ncbi:hypothetical protein Tco_1469925 [Tanacetum coccineum]
MACNVSWKSKLSTINEENVLLKTQVDFIVKERESIKLEYQKLFNSIKATRTQHQKELDDIPLVSVYTTGNVLVRGMQILNEFLTEEIRATDNYKEYEIGKKRKQRARETISPRKPLKATIRQKKQSTPLIPPLGDDQERDEVAEATILSLTLHKIALAAEAQENIAKVQEKLDEEEIEKMVEGDEDEESYASEFADSMINDDVDDSGTRIEPGSHKEHSENVNDDDEEIEKEMKDDEIEKEEKNEDVKKTHEVVKEKDNDEDLSSNKTISEELTTTVSPTTATTSKDSSLPKRKKSMIQEVLDHYNNIIPELTFAKTNEMINKDMPCLVNLAVNKDREVDPINAHEMISKEFATHAPKMIEELFRKHMQNTTLNIYPTRS